MPLFLAGHTNHLCKHVVESLKDEELEIRISQLLRLRCHVQFCSGGPGETMTSHVFGPMCAHQARRHEPCTCTKNSLLPLGTVELPPKIQNQILRRCHFPLPVNSDTRNVRFWRGLDRARCASRSVSTSPKTDITLMTVSPVRVLSTNS